MPTTFQLARIVRSLDDQAIAYAAFVAGIAILLPIYGFYNVKVYLDVFGVDESWFQLAQSISVITNAVNGPLIGCLMDGTTRLRDRRLLILVASPLYVVAFLLTWYPWADYDRTESQWIGGIQLTWSLCSFDAALTLVLLLRCAILSEIATDNAQRIRFTWLDIHPLGA